MLDDFIDNLFRPLQFLEKLKERSNVPWGLWILYGFIAVLGTLLFGLAFGLVYGSEGSHLTWSWAITVAAGSGWLILVPLLALSVAAENRWLVLHACLITMVYGEGILEIGTILNLIGYWSESISADHALIGNAVLVAISNVAMAASICAQMKQLGTSVSKTLLTWLIILNGVGAGIFIILYRGIIAV